MAPGIVLSSVGHQCGIVDQHMDRPEGMPCPIKERRDSHAVGNVTLKAKMPRRLLIELGRQAGQTRLIDVAAHHGGSMTRERHCDGEAEATSRSSDQGHPALHRAHLHVVHSPIRHSMHHSELVPLCGQTRVAASSRSPEEPKRKRHQHVSPD